MPQPPALAELLYRAYAAPIGIVVATADLIALRNKLYVIRKDIPNMDELSFVVSPINGKDLWILHKRIPVEVLNGPQS